jgi:hypothetical protein
MQQALSDGKIAEGHTRPLLMLADRPQEQETLFREVMLKRLTVRDTEAIARRIAVDRVRKKEYLYSPEILSMEKELTEALGTRVAIETKENGGKLAIDFMNEDDLRAIFNHLAARIAQSNAAPAPTVSPVQKAGQTAPQNGLTEQSEENRGPFVERSDPETSIDDRTKEEITKDENTFDPNNFSL